MLEAPAAPTANLVVFTSATVVKLVPSQVSASPLIGGIKPVANIALVCVPDPPTLLLDVFKVAGRVVQDVPSYASVTFCTVGSSIPETANAAV